VSDIYCYTNIVYFLLGDINLLETFH